MNEPLTSGSAALDGGERKILYISAASQQQPEKLRVAAYCRVSSDSTDQLLSFAAQYQYYSQLILSHEDWTLVDIFADEGITGTCAKKRTEFQRMMDACRSGRIDCILCKSISRFARNTKECLEAIRELRNLGVSMRFETSFSGITAANGELEISMYAAIAQAESESISGNMRWSNRSRMADGTYISSSVPYGYVLKEGRLEINPEEAPQVQQIFRLYLSGMGQDAIAQALNQQGHTTALGHPWSRAAIDYVLTNERYAGDSCLQKYYTTDAFPYKKRINQGALPRYYVKDTHPAIIPPDQFRAAQTLSAKRAAYYGHRTNGSYPFSGKIVCACGSPFRRKVSRGIVYWTCIAHDQNAASCPVTQIPERQFEQAFLRLYYILRRDRDRIVAPILTDLRKLREQQMLWSEDVIALNKQISDLHHQVQLLADLKTGGLIASDLFVSMSNTLSQKIKSAKQTREQLLDTGQEQQREALKELYAFLDSGPEFLACFDPMLFEGIVEKITVLSNDRLRFQLLGGITLNESIERTVR